jgi:prepilin-type N-terminal cleavage/methylation domain-containing protein/prepilin-type processing-associated H-X9-DG protein
MDSIVPTARRAAWPTGFTVTELLVVVAIVSLLVAMLAVAARGLRDSSRVTVDLAALRSLQTAQLAYATDQKGFLADAGLPHGSGGGNPAVSFLSTLAPYADHPLAFRSPLDRSPHWATADGGEGQSLAGTTAGFRRTSYGINTFLSRQYSPWVAINPAKVTDRLGRIPHPAGTVHCLHMAPTGAYAGSDHPHVEGWGSLPTAPLAASAQVDISVAGGPPRSIESRGNWSFLDGHVATMKFGELYVNPETNRFDPFIAGLFDRRFTAASAGGS